jgi:hypothetical protein
MKWLLFACLLTPGAAQAITNDQTGVNIQLSPSLFLGGIHEENRLRFRAGAGGAARLTFWWGRYDSSFALGRYWGAGLAPQHHWTSKRQALYLPVHVERGMDLIVLGLRYFVSGGPALYFRESSTTLGGQARVGTTLKYRMNKNVGPTLTFQAGIDIEDARPLPAGEIMLGFDFSGRLGRKHLDH